MEASVKSAREGINPSRRNVPRKLYTVSSIELKNAVIVLPRNSEANGPLWFGNCEKGKFVKLALFGILKEW
jgi:hypothetical protein